MSGFWTALTGSDGLSVSSFATELSGAIPYLKTMIPFAFGLAVVRRAIKSAPKGKIRI